MLRNRLQLPVSSLTQILQYHRSQGLGDRSLKTIEFNILSANGISILHQGKHFVGKHLAENIHTSYDVTIYLISIVTTIILVIADPILCNANRDAREFIISTFKCYKEWKKKQTNKTKQNNEYVGN